MKKILIALAFVLCAATAHAGPLADSIKWSIPNVAGYTLDHVGSVYFSQHPELNCYESNPMLMNPDGTMNGPRSALVKAGITASAVGMLYLTKRLRWRYAESVTKGLMLAQAGQSTYLGYKGFHACR